MEPDAASKTRSPVAACASDDCERMAEVPIADGDGVYAVLGPVKGRLRRPLRKASAAAPLTGLPRRTESAVTSAMGTTARSKKPKTKTKAVLSPSAIAESTPTRSETQSNGGQKERTAMRSVGLDLGKKEVSYCEVQGGNVIARRTARGLSELDDLLGSEGPPAKVAFEACREAWHVYDTLTKRGHKVLLIDTTRVKQLGVGQHGRKRDRIDAEVFARAVERGQIPLAHVLSPHRRELREKLNARRILVETRARLVTMVRGVVRARGEELDGCDTEDFRRKLGRSSLSEGARAAIGPVTAVLETVDVQLSHVETELETLAAKEPVISRLTSTPGVNLIVAAVFVSVVDQAKRFSNAHALESYLGLVPREDTTGGRDKQKLGSITKCGNPYARAMLVQAAWCILRGRGVDPLRAWARSVERRRGKRIAVVALARRLAGVLWAIWRDGYHYDPARLGNASARGIEGAARKEQQSAAAMRLIAKKAAGRARKIAARLTRGKTARPQSFKEVTI
jgi:transposase